MRMVLEIFQDLGILRNILQALKIGGKEPAGGVNSFPEIVPKRSSPEELVEAWRRSATSRGEKESAQIGARSVRE